MRNPLKLFAWLGGIALLVPAHGDIAPTTFVGSGIVPVDNSSIRMARAVVNIDWGTPCRLTATFTMKNESTEPVSVRLGFPISSALSGHETDAQLGFSISFNGTTLDRSLVERKIGGRWKDQIWYYCDHDFPPGETLVETSCNLPASLFKGLPYREQIEYCIETGGKWNGPIGYEEVNFNFPSALHRDQIITASPAGYETTARGLRWVFRDLEPRDPGSDIRISYWLPGIREKLDDIRQACREEAPNDASQALRLARHLFLLGPSGGYSISLPHSCRRRISKTCLAALPTPPTGPWWSHDTV